MDGELDFRIFEEKRVVNGPFESSASHLHQKPLENSCRESERRFLALTVAVSFFGD